MAAVFISKLAARAPVFDRQHSCFKRDGLAYSGLLPTLRKVFYPSFCIRRRRAARRPPGSVQRSYVTKARGCRVHAQLGVWCRTGLLPVDPLASQIATSLRSRGIKLHACEVPISDDTARVATAIDAIGEDSEGRVVVLEFKAGYQKGTRGHAPLRELTTKTVPSTPLNHALLQLGMTRAILAENYDVHATQHLLVVSNSSGVALRTLPVWTTQLSCAQIRLRQKGNALPDWGCSETSSDDE